MTEFQPESRPAVEPSVAANPQPYAQPAQPSAPQPFPQAPAESYLPVGGQGEPMLGVELAPQGNVGLALLAGAGAGLVAAFLYAVISSLIHIEVLFLIIIVGAIVGWTVARVARRGGVLMALASAVIATASLLFAAGLMTLFGTWGVPTGLARLPRADFGSMIGVYFSDPMSFLFVAVGIGTAFFQGLAREKN